MHFYNMHENRVKMDSKGRILIPAHIRHKLGMDKFLKLEPDKMFNSNALRMSPYFGEINEKETASDR